MDQKYTHSSCSSSSIGSFFGKIWLLLIVSKVLLESESQSAHGSLRYKKLIRNQDKYNLYDF